MAAVLKTISKFVIGLFSLAIIGTMMVFTYGALGKIFTGNLLYIMFGMLLFDIATLAWGIAFIFQSRGILQYAAAAMGFVVGLIGTIGMIGAEVMLEGMTPEQIAASPIPTYMRYGFIAVLAIHLVLVYIHHGGEPKIKEEINSGVMVGEVVDEAQRKAQLQMNIMSDALASQLMVGTLNAAIRQLELSSGMKLVTGLPAPQSQIVDVTPQDVPPGFTTTCLICGKPTRGTAYCNAEHYNILRQMADAPKQEPRPAPTPAKDEPAPAPGPFPSETPSAQ